jgi:hypothetical protein
MLHVAVTGDDGRDGLTPATAWRTVRSAACRARPGDTVVVHGGTYEEYAPVRVTGDEGRPITFRCAPGETVWFEGSGQKRPTAFRLAFKHHVHLDGFYFRHFRSKSYATAASAGVVHVVAGSSNVARRCFYDGRTITYMPYFVLASDSRSLTLENCVVIEGWNCVSVERCPDLLVRHCVFYNGLIRNLMLFNDAGQKATLSHNLICDNIPEKRGNSLIELWHLESHRGDHNAFFLRPEAGERRVIGYVRVKGEKDAGALTLAEVQKATGQEGNSLLANPGIPVVKEMARSYKAAADHARIELRREGDKIAPLDFKDFFADPNGPSARAADGRPIGLDPAAFPDGKP